MYSALITNFAYEQNWSALLFFVLSSFYFIRLVITEISCNQQSTIRSLIVFTHYVLAYFSTHMLTSLIDFCIMTLRIVFK